MSVQKRRYETNKKQNTAAYSPGPISTRQRNAIRMAFLLLADRSPLIICLLGMGALEALLVAFAKSTILRLNYTFVQASFKTVFNLILFAHSLETFLMNSLIVK